MKFWNPVLKDAFDESKSLCSKGSYSWFNFFKDLLKKVNLSRSVQKSSKSALLQILGRSIL
jgi:hypothetical protein